MANETTSTAVQPHTESAAGTQSAPGTAQTATTATPAAAAVPAASATPAAAGGSTLLGGAPAVPAAGGTLLGGSEAKPGEKTETGKPGEPAKTGAPEKYTDFTLPEGVKADPEGMTQFQTVAKDLNLSQEQAQKLVDLQMKFNQQNLQRGQQAELNQRLAWRQEVAASPNFQQDQVYARQAITRFADADAVKLLTDKSSWLSDNPAMFRLLSKIGKELAAEDRMLGGDGNSGSRPLTAQALYPSMKQP